MDLVLMLKVCIAFFVTVEVTVENVDANNV
jgi:hypothetical protein